MKTQSGYAISLVLGGIVGLFCRQGTPRIVDAEGFRVMKDGKTLIDIGYGDEGDGRVNIYDKSGVVRLRAGVGNDGEVSVKGFDSSGKEQFSISQKENQKNGGWGEISLGAGVIVVEGGWGITSQAVIRASGIEAKEWRTERRNAGLYTASGYQEAKTEMR